MSDTFHHDLEFVEVNFSVAVLVDFSNGALKLRLAVNVAELFPGEERAQLGPVNLAAVVSVDHLKCSAQVVITQENGLIHGGSQEF